MIDIETLEGQEPLFVNQCTYTKKALTHFYWETLPLGRKIYSAAAFVLFLSLGVFYLFYGTQVLGIVCLILSLLTWPTLFHSCHIRANQIIKQAQAVYPTPNLYTTFFYDEGVLVCNEGSGGKIALEYSQLSIRFQSKDTYFLSMKRGVFIILDKTGFQKGSPNDFEAFLRQKPANPEPRKKKPWAVFLKWVGIVASLLLLIVSVIFSGICINNMRELRPASAYTDMGIYHFIPHDILSVPSKDGASMSYAVEYRSDSAMNYVHYHNVGESRAAAQQLYEQGSVERRVLILTEDHTYFTTPANQTAQEYIMNLRIGQILILLLFSSYIVLYVEILFILILHKRKKRHPSL